LLIVLVRIFTNEGAIVDELQSRDLTDVEGRADIIMYMDVSCEHSQEGWDKMLKLKQTYGDNLGIRVRHFPLSMEAVGAANAVQCASDQGKHMDYTTRIFDNQDKLDSNSLKNYGWAEGLDVFMFHDCIDNSTYLERIKQDLKDGYEEGVRSTPTFFVEDQMLVGVKTYSEFQSLIDSELGIQ